ncbi:Sensor protein CitS [uncultured Clostridium sp.]|nr:Sensor protein CitS [uncultured Clostridium sp.]
MTDLYLIEKLGDFIGANILIYFFNKNLQPKNEKYSRFNTVIMIIFYTLISSLNINNLIFNMDSYKIILFISTYSILILIYPLLFRRGRLPEKIFLFSFYISTILMNSFIGYMIFSKLFNVTLIELMINLSYKRSIAMITNRFFQFLFTFKLIDNMNLIGYIKDKILLTGGLILFLNHILIFIVQIDLIKYLRKTNLNVAIIIISLYIIQLLSIYILNILSKEMEEKFILKMELDREIHNKEIESMYSEVIGWRHDIKNHINMILGLLEISSKKEVVSYIREIDTRIDRLDPKIYTENVAINSILISKVKLAKEKEIKIDLDIKINSNISITNLDMCTILGNLLDNSIEACDIIEGDKFIDLKIVSEDKGLIIKISNSTNGYVNEVNGKFVTIKDKRINGIGIIQIDRTVKKYNGYINRKHEGSIFTTYIMIQ